MSDSLPTVWKAESHTLAKHAVLKNYLDAWFPILTSQARIVGGQREILYIDGFAGPGEYEKGESGSPVIALRAAGQHSLNFPLPVRMVFVEERKDRYVHLQSVLAKEETSVKSNNVRLEKPKHGDCSAVLDAILTKHEEAGVQFGPALAFLDQFGFSGVSMGLVSRILKYSQCEVFLYLDYKDMNRWITDPNKATAFTRAFGGDEWKEAIAMTDLQRREFLLSSYRKALIDRGRAKYVSCFSMFDKQGRLLYWLIFCTGSIRGLEEMKKAMWRVDKTGAFRFSDKESLDKTGKLLEDSYDQAWLAEILRDKLAGKAMTVDQVKEFVLTKTPCYLYKEALAKLENNKKLKTIDPMTKRRRGSFADPSMKIFFADKELF